MHTLMHNTHALSHLQGAHAALLFVQAHIYTWITHTHSQGAAHAALQFVQADMPQHLAYSTNTSSIDTAPAGSDKQRSSTQPSVSPLLVVTEDRGYAYVGPAGGACAQSLWLFLFACVGLMFVGHKGFCALTCLRAPHAHTHTPPCSRTSSTETAATTELKRHSSRWRGVCVRSSFRCSNSAETRHTSARGWREHGGECVCVSQVPGLTLCLVPPLINH